MTNRLFNFHLFQEGVRQSRSVGLIGLITTVAFTLLMSVGMIGDKTVFGAQQTYSFGSVGAVLIAQYCIFSPIMVFCLFRYLNRRNASDFYHAIPHKRVTLHLSYFAAVMFWNVITTLTVTASILVVYATMADGTLQYGTLFSFVCNMLAAQFSVAAGVLLAMSITGTAFSNLLVSLIILLMPRIVITAMSSMIQDICIIADVYEQAPLLDPSLNIVSGIPITFISSFFNGNADPGRCLSDPVCGLYTLCLGSITLIGAMLLLNRRKSETATKAAPARWLQAVYRIAFGTVLGLPAVAVLFDAIISNNLKNNFNPTTFFGFLFGAILFYYILELIATKKPKNLLTAIPGMLIFLVIDAAILMACFGLGNSILQFSPEAEDIHHITITIRDDNYFTADTSTIPIEDPQAKAIAAEGLEKTIDLVKNKQISFHQDHGIIPNYVGGPGFATYKIGFNTDDGTTYRYVVLNGEQVDQLVNAISSHDEYQESFYEFPPESAVQQGTFAHGNKEPSQKEAVALYRSYIEEAKSLPFDTWHSIAMASHRGYDYSTGKSLGTIVLKPTRDGHVYNMVLNIDPERFPKTARLLTDTINKDYTKQLADMTALLTDLQAQGKVTSGNHADGTYLYLIADTIFPHQYHLSGVDRTGVNFALPLLSQCEPYTWEEDQIAVGISVSYTDNSQADPQQDYYVLVGLPFDALSHCLVNTR